MNNPTHDDRPNEIRVERPEWMSFETWAEVKDTIADRIDEVVAAIRNERPDKPAADEVDR